MTTCERAIGAPLISATTFRSCDLRKRLIAVGANLLTTFRLNGSAAAL
jgi:hypothetical protein